jgi:hypothetical protein
MISMQAYFGTCHCGGVTFEVTMELKNALECNCSHCFAKGFLLGFVPESSLTILSGKDLLTEYRFNKRHISHLFCKVCGVQTFGQAPSKEGEPTYAINLRALKDVDIQSLEITPYDGKSI